tara:strand:- start:1100 stop:1384 length:285 start_codon:yes stop_codon:yes gene_type:complete
MTALPCSPSPLLHNLTAALTALESTTNTTAAALQADLDRTVREHVDALMDGFNHAHLLLTLVLIIASVHAVLAALALLLVIVHMARPGREVVAV